MEGTTVPPAGVFRLSEWLGLVAGEETVKVEFNDAGEFAAVRAAEDWCAKHGLSVGPMQRGEPRGILFGAYDIQKWRNLRQADKDALHGMMTGDMRNGPVFLLLSEGDIRRAGGLLPAEAGA